MGVPVIGTVSEKRAWVEKTLSSLDEGFDKKQLLESADALQDAELRSLIATSITASMAKRKLEQYLSRLGNAPDEPEEPAKAPDEPVKTPEANEPPKSEPAPEPVLPAEEDDAPKNDSADTDPAPENDTKKESDAAVDGSEDFSRDPGVVKKAPKPAEPVRSTKRPDPKPVSTKPRAPPEPVKSAPEPKPSDPAPKKSSSAERFDKLEKTVLASKSKSDLAIPDIPEDMVGTIRQLKDLAQRKAAEPVKSFEPKKRPALRSDALLKAFGEKKEDEPEPITQSVPEVAEPISVRDPDPTVSQAPQTPQAPENLEQKRSDALDTLDEFEAFLSEPAQKQDAPPQRSSELFSDAPQAEPAEEPAASEPTAQSSPPPTASEVQDSPADDITARFDDLLATMGEINTDLPHAKDQETSAPASEPVSEPVNQSSPAVSEPSQPSSSSEFSSEPEQAPPAPPPPPSQPAQAPPQTMPQSPSPSLLQKDPEPQRAPTEYDGSWIESCESISDIIDALETVQGSVQDVRTTIALFFLGFSEDLARTIRTAQNRDEIELMLRKALTATIDDAFERTAARFAKEQESFDEEAESAAQAFDSAILAQEAERKRHDEELEQTHLREQQERERLEQEAEEEASRVLAERKRLDQERIEKEREQHEREEAQEAERKKQHAHEKKEHHESSPEPTPDLFASARAAHAHAEKQTDEDLSKPVVKHERKTLTLAARIAQHIESLHDLIEAGDYDAALATLGEARGLLARQIELKTHRSEPVIDERMADFELKALALDLEILKARE